MTGATGIAQVAVTGAWLGIAALLVLSGAAKLPRARAAVPQRFLASGGWTVPVRWIQGAAVVELLLGLALLLADGGAAVAVTAAVAALLLLYTVVVVVVRSRDATVGCGCHGQDAGEVTSWTVVRNVALLATAVGLFTAAVVSGGLRGAAGPGSHIAVAWAALLVTALVVLGRRLIRGHAAPSDVAAPAVIDPWVGGPDDYVRWPIPDAPVHDADGTRRPLRSLSARGAVVLVLVDPSARQFLPLARWRSMLGRSEVVTGAVLSVGQGGASDAALLPVYVDRTGAARAMLGITELPAAVLLGADGWLAGGPTLGGVAGIDQLIELVLDELGAAADR